MSVLPPLGLYVHFPWCVAKCPYCDFNSHSLRGELEGDVYIDALINDLRVSAPVVAGREVQTVFFGGGTPSLFDATRLGRLLEAVRAELQLSPAAEVTLEANPGAVEHAAFAGYLEAGINRLSLGVQSFSAEKLQALGRIHSVEDVHAAYAEARSAGFANINLDLMYALPAQTPDEALADIEQAIALAPEHISHYHLTLEPNTVFYARPPELPAADDAWEAQSRCASRLDAAGYDNYEVSAWGLPGKAARHNLNYWRFGDYLGIGAGAHAKLTVEDDRWRETRPAHPQEYLRSFATAAAAGDFAPQRQRGAAADTRFEFMLNNLRLRAGFALSDFEQLTGQPRAALAPSIAAACERGLLQVSGTGQVRATPRGWRFLDDLQGIFLPDIDS